LKKIGRNAFSDSGLKNLIFKKGSRIKVIGYYTFAGCTELKVVRLPPSVTEIEYGAFASSGLKKVIFKKGSKLKTIGPYVSAYLLLFPNVPRLPQYESYCVP